MATGADLGHPGVEGPRTARWRLLNAYIRRLFGVAHRDPVVADAALKVLGMVSPAPTPNATTDRLARTQRRPPARPAVPVLGEQFPEIPEARRRV